MVNHMCHILQKIIIIENKRQFINSFETFIMYFVSLDTKIYVRNILLYLVLKNKCIFKSKNMFLRDTDVTYTNKTLY